MTAPTRTTGRTQSPPGRGPRGGTRSAPARSARTQRASASRSAGAEAPRRSARSHTAAAAPHKSGKRPAANPGKGTAAQKAYARRAQRTASLAHPHPPGVPVRRLAHALRLPTSRAGFVLMMMGLLSAGVALTLWLSTQAIADSYRLEAVRAETARLAERAERLQQDVTRQQTASALAQKARALGMVPSESPAHLLVTPGGKVTLFGEPKKAQPQRLPPPPARPSRPQTGDTAPRESAERDDDRSRTREEPRRDSGAAGEREQVRAAAESATGTTDDTGGTSGER